MNEQISLDQFKEFIVNDFENTEFNPELAVLNSSGLQMIDMKDSPNDYQELVMEFDDNVFFKTMSYGGEKDKIMADFIEVRLYNADVRYCRMHHRKFSMTIEAFWHAFVAKTDIRSLQLTGTMKG